MLIKTGIATIVIFFIFLFSISYAMTIDVDVNRYATEGQTVTADIKITFDIAEAGKQACPVSISWDDPPGSSDILKENSCVKENDSYVCTWHAKHVYTFTGIFMISAKSVANHPQFPGCIPSRAQAAETSIEVRPISPDIL